MVFVGKAIGKMPDIAGVETDPATRKDYTIGFNLDHVLTYEMLVVDPEHPYYQYDGPLTEIFFTNGSVRMIMVPWAKFHKAYCDYKLVKTITINPQ